MINVIDRIKELMDKKGWSCYELSAQTGIATNSVYDWFKIGATPSMGNIIKICDAMSITLEQFFCGDKQYCLNEEENKIMSEWFSLSELERKAVMDLIETFKVLKHNA